MGLHTPEVSMHSRVATSVERLSSIPQAFTLILGDILSLTIAYGVAKLVLDHLGVVNHMLSSTLIWGGFWIIWRARQGLYPGYGRSPQTELRAHVTGTFQVAVFQLVSALALQNLLVLSKTIVLEWLIVIVVALPIRYLLRELLIKTGHFGRKVSIIGAGETAHLLIDYLRNHPEYGFVPIAAYDDNSDLHGKVIEGIPIIGDIESAIVQPMTDQALISIPSARAETAQRIINGVYSGFSHTWVVPDLFGVPNQAIQTHNIGSVASLEIKNNLRSIQARFIKRTIDILGAGIGGLLISPILLMIMLAIKLDSPGPVVYKARRLGKNGQVFSCLKFRSMHRDAEAKLKEVLDADPALKAEFAATHKLKDDPRVTRVGTFLRKTSLDELPQLGNVLNGTMSLVGPRPIVKDEIEKYGDIYEVYKQVRPGMTGYWQANGRSDTSYVERVSMDNFYVTNWTPWLDIVILIQTVKVVLMGKGAY